MDHRLSGLPCSQGAQLSNLCGEPRPTCALSFNATQWRSISGAQDQMLNYFGDIFPFLRQEKERKKVIRSQWFQNKAAKGSCLRQESQGVIKLLLKN